jgi:signal peptide peptidase SppA
VSHRVPNESVPPFHSLGQLARVEAAGRTWAILPEVLTDLWQLRTNAADVLAVEEHIRANVGAEQMEAAVRRGRPAAINGDVAVIPLKGVITPQASLLAQIFGLGGGLSQFRAQLSEAVTDEKVGAIVLDIDSPGGIVDLVPETAAEIRSAAKVKPITAVANTMAASAAYWLGSQATDFAVSPSGTVGSIGVYTEHRDVSKALESGGMQPTLVSAGKYKVEGNPYQPLDDEAREAMQRTVDEYYGMFVRDVAAGRDTTVTAVRSGYGEGRVLTAKRAVDEGLVDKVATIEEVVSGYTRRSRPSGANALAYSAEDKNRLVSAYALLGLSHTTEGER